MNVVIKEFCYGSSPGYGEEYSYDNKCANGYGYGSGSGAGDDFGCDIGYGYGCGIGSGSQKLVQ